MTMGLRTWSGVWKHPVTYYWAGLRQRERDAALLFTSWFYYYFKLKNLFRKIFFIINIHFYLCSCTICCGVELCWCGLLCIVCAEWNSDCIHNLFFYYYMFWTNERANFYVLFNSSSFCSFYSALKISVYLHLVLEVESLFSFHIVMCNILLHSTLIKDEMSSYGMLFVWPNRNFWGHTWI